MVAVIGQSPRMEGEPENLSRPPLFRAIVALSLLVLMGLGIFLGVDKLQDARTLPLRVVRIEGEFRHLNNHALQRAVAAEIRGGFFTVDVEAVRAAARKLPWVAEAEVRRVWPDTLDIRVEEQTPLARWGEKRLVNSRGEMFLPAAGEIPAGLPLLLGPPGTEAAMVARYRAMRQRLGPLGLHIVRLQQDARQAWSLEFANGALLLLGSRDTEVRLARFIRIYPRLQAAGRGALKQADLRYTNGFVVHWEKRSTKSEKGITDGNGLA